MKTRTQASNDFLPDGRERLEAAQYHEIERRVAARFADELASAGPLRRLQIRLAIRREVRREWRKILWLSKP